MRNLRLSISLASQEQVWNTVRDSSSTAVLQDQDRREDIYSTSYGRVQPQGEGPWGVALLISLWTSVWNTGCATSSVMNFSSIDILFAFIIILGYHTKLSHLYPTKITICLNFLSLLLLHLCLLPRFCLLLLIPLLFPHLFILLVGEHDQPHNLPVENTVSLVDQIGDID